LDKLLMDRLSEHSAEWLAIAVRGEPPVDMGSGKGVAEMGVVEHFRAAALTDALAHSLDSLTSPGSGRRS
jgi:hypothetical protein